MIVLEKNNIIINITDDGFIIVPLFKTYFHIDHNYQNANIFYDSINRKLKIYNTEFDLQHCDKRCFATKILDLFLFDIRESRHLYKTKLD